MHRGRCYDLNNVGVLACFDAATGSPLHRGRLGFESWATPVGAGDRVYCFGRGGECTVLAAADQFEVLAENTLDLPGGTHDGPAQEEPAGGDADAAGPPAAGGYDGPFVYGAAPLDGGFLLRTESRLYRVGTPRRAVGAAVGGVAGAAAEWSEADAPERMVCDDVG